MAIIFLYGEDVTEQQLATDQMLLHFSNLSMHMNGELVLRKVNTDRRRRGGSKALTVFARGGHAAAPCTGFMIC